MNQMLNSNPYGNSVFHLACNADGSLQPIINTVLKFDYDLICLLLHTDNIGCKTVRFEDDALHLLLFDGNKQKPYPSIIVMKYVFTGQDVIYQDVGQSDINYMPRIIEEFLR